MDRGAPAAAARADGPRRPDWRPLALLALLLAGGVALAAQGWEDGFDREPLAARWQWRVPVAGPTLSLTENPGWLRIRLPDRAGGFNHWHEPTPVDEAPQLRTAAPDGDWELETHVRLHQVAADSHLHVGLVVGSRDDRLLAFGPFQAPSLPTGPKAPEACLEPTGLSGFARVPGDARDLYLRLTRTGARCRAQCSRDGRTWTEAGNYLLGGPPAFLGFLAKTFATGTAAAVDVDYLRLTPLTLAAPAGRRALVGVAGDYPTGYRGLLARLGLPYNVLLDYQLAEVDALRRFDLLLVGSVSDGIAQPAREALARYVSEGGTALLDARAFPPSAVTPGTGGQVPSEKMPDVYLVGAGNPLLPLLGTTIRFAAGESRFHFQPASEAGLQVLARYAGQPGRDGPPGRAADGTGAPAIWAQSLGRGLLVYSSPSIGATLSWGPTHDALAEALIRCLGWGRLEPQLVPEGARLGRKQTEPTQAQAAVAETTPAAPEEPAVTRVRPSAPPEPLPTGTRVVRSKAAPEFDLSGVYHPARGSARLLLNHWSQAYHVTVLFDGTSARLTRTEGGKTVDTATLPLAADRDSAFLLKERLDRIVLLVDGRRATLRADRLWEGRLAAAGEALENVRYQPVEAPRLGDDFMRGEKEQGAWETAGGQWSVRATGDPKMGANPFTYRGQAQGVGLAVAGLPFWDDYAFAVSAKPGTDGGALALAFHVRDPANALLFRLRLSASPGQDRDGVQVVRLADGQESVLARRDGCLLKGQWYRLSVQVRDGAITACVDGRTMAEAETGGLTAGRIGLYLRDAEAEFDDVAVCPLAEVTSPAAVELDGTVPRFAGTLDRDTWAGTALQWRAIAAAPGCFQRRGPFWGDFDLTFRGDFRTPAGAGAAVALLLAAADGAVDGGYAFTLRPAHAPVAGNAPADYEAELTRQGETVGRCTLTAGAEPALELRRIGSALLALVDGRQALSCRLPEAPAEWPRLGLLATSLRPRISGLHLQADHVLDYCFDRAPTDWWVGSGSWELAVRWPCTPEWSWLTGESRQVAALWHKRDFAGDVLLDLHVGPRTIDHGDGGPAREICRAFNLVLCGDGQAVTSGYSFVLGSSRDGAGAALARQGRVVADNPAYRIYSDAHNQWLNVRAEKRGRAVALWVGDQRVLAWEDPEPLPGGRLAVWTRDNAIMIPRVTVYFREP